MRVSFFLNLPYIATMEHGSNNNVDEDALRQQQIDNTSILGQQHFANDSNTWSPKQAIEQFVIPPEYDLAEIPKPSKLKSPLYDLGIKVVRKDTGNLYWFCCASKQCFDNQLVISIRKSTSMATVHLQNVHGLLPSEKRGPRRNSEPVHDSSMYHNVSNCGLIFFAFR